MDVSDAKEQVNNGTSIICQPEFSEGIAHPICGPMESGVNVGIVHPQYEQAPFRRNDRYIIEKVFYDRT